MQQLGALEVLRKLLKKAVDMVVDTVACTAADTVVSHSVVEVAAFHQQVAELTDLNLDQGEPQLPAD